MSDKKIKQETPIDHWVELNTLLARQRLLSVVAFSLVAVLAVGLVCLSFKDPLVAIVEGKSSLLVATKRSSVMISRQDIERVIRNYVTLRYSWEELDPEVVSKNLSPFVTKGAQAKIFAGLQKTSGTFKDKKTRQTVADFSLDDDKKSIVANFYKVLEVEGVLLAQKMKLSFQLEQGKRTHWNPAGLYINGIIEYSGGAGNGL